MPGYNPYYEKIERMAKEKGLSPSEYALEYLKSGGSNGGSINGGSNLQKKPFILKQYKGSGAVAGDKTINASQTQVNDFIGNTEYSVWGGDHPGYRKAIQAYKGIIPKYIAYVEGLAREHQAFMREINMFSDSLSGIVSGANVSLPDWAALCRKPYLTTLFNPLFDSFSQVESELQKDENIKIAGAVGLSEILGRVGLDEMLKRFNQKQIRKKLEKTRDVRDKINQNLQTGDSLSSRELPKISRWVREYKDKVIDLQRSLKAQKIEQKKDQVIKKLSELLSMDPPVDYDFKNGVMLDFTHLELIPVYFRKKGKNGNNTIRHLLDPVFAYIVVKFIFDIKNDPILNIIELYGSGFNRSPKRPGDTEHSQGRAFDILGFKVGQESLGRNRDGIFHLRGGYMASNNNDPSSKTYIEKGPSDWFYNADPETGVNRYMYLFAQKFKEYFGHFIGPGYNKEHMNHFHVQFSRSRKEAEVSIPLNICATVDQNNSPEIFGVKKKNYCKD